jgi:hypothetical protein
MESPPVNSVGHGEAPNCGPRALDNRWCRPKALQPFGMSCVETYLTSGVKAHMRMAATVHRANRCLRFVRGSAAVRFLPSFASGASVNRRRAACLTCLRIDELALCPAFSLTYSAEQGYMCFLICGAEITQRCTVAHPRYKQNNIFSGTDAVNPANEVSV